MLSPTTQNKNIFNGRQLHERTAAAPKRVSQKGTYQYREIALRNGGSTSTPVAGNVVLPVAGGSANAAIQFYFVPGSARFFSDFPYLTTKIAIDYIQISNFYSRKIRPLRGNNTPHPQLCHGCNAI
jgi:hypothetical protein